MEVQSPPGTVIGYIKQDCSFIYPWFSIENAEGDTVLKIKGPFCTCKFCEVQFEVSRLARQSLIVCALSLPEKSPNQDTYAYFSLPSLSRSSPLMGVSQ